MTDTVEKGFSTSAPLWTRGSDSSICTFWGKVRFSKWDPMGTRFYPFTVLSDVRAHFSTVSTQKRSLSHLHFDRKPDPQSGHYRYAVLPNCGVPGGADGDDVSLLIA